MRVRIAASVLQPPGKILGKFAGKEYIDLIEKELWKNVLEEVHHPIFFSIDTLKPSEEFIHKCIQQIKI
jgi:hypothetical protein